MSLEQTHYDVLGVSVTVEPEALKAVFRAMVRKYHPDVSGPEGVEMTGKINHAFDVLSDPDKRQTYDRELREQAESEHAEAQYSTSAPDDYFPYEQQMDSDDYGYVSEQVVDDPAPVQWTLASQRLAGATSLLSIAAFVAVTVHLMHRFMDPMDDAGGWRAFFLLFIGLAFVVGVKRRVLWQLLVPFVFPTLGFLAGAVGWWGFVHAYEVIGPLSSTGLALLLPVALGIRYATPTWWRLLRTRPARNSRQ